MSDFNLVAEFNNAVNQIKNTSPVASLSNDVKLSFYKYYKQATVGDCNIPKPWGVQIEASAKWKAWNSIRGTSKNDAMLAYCELYITYNL